MSVSREDIEHAVRIISEGGVVAFPTETVYGLGADALNEDAVREVFHLKGRPTTNPLIVHVRGIAHARIFAAEWPDRAHELAARFWPGPLTIVVRKNEFIPDLVTSGGDTVALRVPKSEAARALIEAAGVPLVGPSANPSGRVSPTTADHVGADFPGLFVLDDGPCDTGVESTVVTFAEGTPRVLRPGVLGHEQLGVAPFQPNEHDGPLPAPGLFKSHYAPRARVVLDEAEATGTVARLTLPSDPKQAARALYAQLRAHDTDDIDTILVTIPDHEGPVWDAIRDRLTRAAAPRA